MSVRRPSSSSNAATSRRARARAVAVSAGGLVVAVVGAASAGHAPPWLDERAIALPPGTASVHILKADQPLLAEPARDAPRRGSAARDAVLPLYASRAGAGCSGRWLSVGPHAWVCEDAVELTTAAAMQASARTIPEAQDGLPFRYHFVGPDGSFAYKRIEAADLGEPDMQLEPGFAVALLEERVQGGSRYGRTYGGLWVPMRDLGPVRAFAFRGEPIGEGGWNKPFGWVSVDKARVRSSSGAFLEPRATKARFELLPVLEARDVAAGKLLRVDEAAWMLASDVRAPVITEPPPEVDADVGERWIDVDLASQTLVAYEGRRPVFTTLVSTGKGRPGSSTVTPKGTFRVWAKLIASDMDNLEDDNASRYYRMEAVPYVQYFSKGVGLHGAFWHRSFGQVRSHGCVNLAPLDAQLLFSWTSPRLPAGWTAVLPNPHERGSVVRVR